MELEAKKAYHLIMIAMSHPADVPLPSDSAAVNDARIRREEAIIVKAEADIDAGFGVEDDDVEAWLDTLESDPHAPIPSGKGGRADR